MPQSRAMEAIVYSRRINSPHIMKNLIDNLCERNDRSKGLRHMYANTICSMCMYFFLFQSTSKIMNKMSI